MRNKKKLFLIIIPVCLAFFLVGLTVLQKDRIPDKLTEQIKEGQTYEEVMDILGPNGIEVGSGMFIMEWRLQSGDYFHVWFIQNEINRNNWRVSSTSIDEKSFDFR